jgi:cobalt-zinc-cadmium efflux system outer membrane protein
VKLAALIMLAAGVAHADDRQPVTLDQALAAVNAAPAVRAGTYDVAAAQAGVDAASALPNPSLAIGTNRLTARLAAVISIPLPIFGTVGAAKRVAAAEAAVTRADTDLALRDLRHRVIVAWVELQRAAGDVTASQVAAEQATELETIAKGRLGAGTGAEVDVTVAGAARARADVALAAARREQDAASAELAGLLGWDPMQRLRADGAAVIGGAMDLAALRGKLVVHPERAAAERRIAAADANVDAVLVQRRPGLALEGEVDYDDISVTEHDTPLGRTDLRIGVALELPLFAHIGDRARQARATAQAQRMRLAALEAELGGRLVAAYERWQAASERLAALEKDVIPAAEKAAALSMQAYREGARDLASAMVAERDLASARAELNDARAQAALAYANLVVAAGDDHAP